MASQLSLEVSRMKCNLGHRLFMNFTENVETCREQADFVLVYLSLHWYEMFLSCLCTVLYTHVTVSPLKRLQRDMV